jgi:hypothetical protein
MIGEWPVAIKHAKAVVPLPTPVLVAQSQPSLLASDLHCANSCALLERQYVSLQQNFLLPAHPNPLRLAIATLFAEHIIWVAAVIVGTWMDASGLPGLP